MLSSFRQSMTWLHTWAGMLFGCVLYFVFVTGTLGYVYLEIDRWMRPELPPAVTEVASTGDLLSLARDRLETVAAGAKSWSIVFPGGREANGLGLEWETWPAEGEKWGDYENETLDPRTGLPLETQARETGGGYALYVMHYSLHYLPYMWGVRIVGAAAMFMLVALLSGIVIHKRIFKDFFTFRPDRARRSWLDGHVLLSVAALPFFLMITWSGLIFYQYTYMPIAFELFYPEGEARSAYYAEAYGYAERTTAPPRADAPLATLGPILAQVEAVWGPDSVAKIEVTHPGRADAQVTLRSREASIRNMPPVLHFDGVSGEPVTPLPLGTHAGRFSALMTGLHEGHFADAIVRALYLFAGFCGVGMVATGLILWSKKRAIKLASSRAGRFGAALVDTLNRGTVIGLPLGVAAYFWANRLLPIDLPNRAAWEMHTLFIVWGLTFPLTAWRPDKRAWGELCVLAAAAFVLLPVVNALTTERGLFRSLAAGDWTFVGFDFVAFVTGLFFAFLSWLNRRKQHAAPDSADPELA